MDLKMGVLPKRQTVPITVSYGTDEITITSPTDGVNTTIAYQDNFVTDRPCEKEEHLLLADGGTTKIAIVYPHKRAGVLLSIFGLCLWLIL